ncbi:molybdate ABC transporter substrate-binding protein [Vibrio sp. WXL210]|uniref:molybdate ABC transporter substrate-binding protein n=1 Tax=Vibrio sp. WXL210 TaxID=3450709 RepID=UPI003EC6574B
MQGSKSKLLRFFLTWLVFISAMALTLSAQAASELKIAVANNFYVPMQKLAADYEAQHNIKVTLSTGSSGQLATQIDHGAPFDLFFSADQARPTYLEEQGKAEKRFSYAMGTLVLWSQSSDWVEPSSDQPPKLSGRVAMPEPAVAPYGAAAKAFMQNIGIYQANEKRFIYGKGLNATYQFAATGNSQFAFLALSQVLNPESTLEGSYWIVPSDSYPNILQDAVLIKSTRNRDSAQNFIDFIHSPQAQTIITDFGYSIPGGA